MATPDKQEEVAELAKKIGAAKSIILTDFTGMNVLSISELRKKCREAGVEYKVVKNTLARLAVRGSAYESLIEQLEGPTAFAISAVDELAPARVLSEFCRIGELPRIKLGFVEGKAMNAGELRRLAFLPSKEVLLAQFAGTLKRPLSMLSFGLTFKVRQLLRAFEELKKTKTG